MDSPQAMLEQPGARPSDGLLGNPALQEVVELQQARDGEALKELLGHPEAPVRARAAYALASVQDSTAAPGLAALLEDPDSRVRQDAAFALGQLPGNGSNGELFRALSRESDPDVRRLLIEALGKRCEGAGAEALLGLDDDALRPVITLALARCALAGAREAEVWPRLAADLTHPDPRIRSWAAYPFGRVDNPYRWRPHLAAVRNALLSYESDDIAAMHLIRAVGRLGDRLLWRDLAWWLRRAPDWRIRANAAEALGRYEILGPQGYLVAALDDPSAHVRLQSIQGVGQTPPPPVLVAELQRHLRDNPDDVAVARHILEILARLGLQDEVGSWFQRPDIGQEAVLLAGIPGAAALEGPRGVELLARAARTGPTQRSRGAAFNALLDRWDVARPIPGSHELFQEAFQRLTGSSDRLVAEGATEALDDPAFGGGSAEAGDEVEAEESGEGGNASGSPPVRAVDWAHLRALGARPLLHLETTRGRITLELFTEEAPLTVDGIAYLAESGRYDGTPFHRVIPNFVAQGGNVSRFGAEPGAGFLLRSEFTRVPYSRGVLGMASAGKDTESSQFFVTHSAQPHLDGAYTAFGRVVAGFRVLDAVRPEDEVIRAWVTPGG